MCLRSARWVLGPGCRLRRRSRRLGRWRMCCRNRGRCVRCRSRGGERARRECSRRRLSVEICGFVLRVRESLLGRDRGGS